MHSKHSIYGPTDYEIYLDRARDLRDQVMGQLLRSVWRTVRCRVLEPLARSRRRRAAIRALMELSDRQLKDIGITRGQIPETVDSALMQASALPCSGGVSAGVQEAALSPQLKKAA